MGKLKITALLFVLLITGLSVTELLSHGSGAVAGVAGGPGENNCTQCHAGVLNSGPGVAGMTVNALGGQYIPGDTYTVTATLEQSGIVRFGFEILSGYSSGTNGSKGTIIITNTTETQQKALGAKRYVTHKFAGTSGSSTKTWTFDWIAPAAGSGDITFYGAFNAADNLSSASGDKIYTTSTTITEIPVAIASQVNQNIRVQLFPSPFKDHFSISAFGLNLKDASIEVMNLEGEKYNVPMNLSGSILEANTQELTAGIYLVRIVSGENSTLLKAIKF